MAFNYDKLGPLGEWLQQLHRRPLGTIDVEKNYAAKQYDKDGNMNLALKGGKKDGWMLLKINKKKDRKKPNEREIKDKIKKLMEKEEEEKEEDLESYYKGKKRMKKLKKATSKRHRRMIRQSKKQKKGGSKRTRKKRGGGDWDKMEDSDQNGYEKKKRLNKRQYKYYLDYGEDIKPYHADFMITKDENGGYIHLNKFGKEITLASGYLYENGINYAIETLKKLHEMGIFHGDIVSGDTEIKWNKGNILFNEEGEYKLIDFGPTDREKRGDEELIKAEKNILNMKTGRDEDGNLNAPPSIKKTQRVKPYNLSPRAPRGESFMSLLNKAEDDENLGNQENRLSHPTMLLSSPSSSPKSPKRKSLVELYSPPKRRRGRRLVDGGKRKNTKKKRKRKRKRTKKKRRRRR